MSTWPVQKQPFFNFILIFPDYSRTCVSSQEPRRSNLVRSTVSWKKIFYFLLNYCWFLTLKFSKKYFQIALLTNWFLQNNWDEHGFTIFLFILFDCSSTNSDDNWWDSTIPNLMFLWSEGTSKGSLIGSLLACSPRIPTSNPAWGKSVWTNFLKGKRYCCLCHVL